MSNKIKNIYWLVGDRYMCGLKKNQIIKDITKENGWDVKEFLADSTELFLSTINQNSIFGNNKTIYVHEGTIPEQNKTIPFLEKFTDQKNKILIIIEGDGISNSKIDKRTAMYKKYSNIACVFDNVIQSTGFPDKKIIPVALNHINEHLKKIYPGTKISKDIVEDIFVYNRYDYGTTINEIEKITILLGKVPQNFNEIKSLLYVNEKTADEAAELSSRFLYKESIDILLNIVKTNKNVTESLMLYFYSLSEKMTFMLHCKNALSIGINDSSEIGNFVSKHWVKKDKPVDAYSSEKRYWIIKDLLSEIDSRQIVLINNQIEKALNRIKYDKFSPISVINEFIIECTKIYN